MATKKSAIMNSFALSFDGPMRYAVVRIRQPLQIVSRFFTIQAACDYIRTLYEPSTYGVFRCVGGGIQQLSDMDAETVQIILNRQHARYNDDGDEVQP